jgi:hypothetical protein
MRTASLTSLAASFLVAAPSLAEPPAAPSPPPRARVEATLRFSVAPELARCPGETRLRDEVSRRMGYDPFAPAPGGVSYGLVRVAIARSGSGLTARYEHEDPSAELAFRRVVNVPSDDRESCDLAISAVGAFLAIELASFARRKPPPPPPERPRAAPVAERPLSPRPERPPGRGPVLRFEAGVGAAVLGGVGRGLSGMGSIRVGVAVAPSQAARTRLLIALEGRGNLPRTSAEGARAQLFGGALLVCAARDFFPGAVVTWGGIGCLLSTVGTLRGSLRGQGDHPSIARTAIHASLGARLGWEARFGSSLAVRAEADLAPTIQSVELVLPGRAARVGMAGLAASTGFSLVFSR